MRRKMGRYGKSWRRWREGRRDRNLQRMRLRR